MNPVYVRRALLALLCAVVVLWTVITPARAQLLPGCSCPAGFTPLTGTTCRFNAIVVPAICPNAAYNNTIGQIAASLQQQSFWGINTVLQQKRDQLQRTSTSAGASPNNSANTRSAFDDTNATLISRASSSQSSSDGEDSVLAYAATARNDNPLASNLVTKAPASPPAPPVSLTWGAWVQGLADVEHDNPLSATDVGHTNQTFTGQAGVDATRIGLSSANDALVVGLVSSWTQSHVDYVNSPTSMQMVGPGVGIYSEYVKGGLSADLTTKFDFLNMNQNLGGAGPNTSISVINAGLAGDVQYKVAGLGGKDSDFVEPTGGFALTHTGFGAGAAGLGLQDAYTLRLQAGARAGTSWAAGNGVTIDGSLKALLYSNVIAEGTSVANATGSGIALPSISPSDQGLLRGEFDPQLAFNFPDNYSVTVAGQVRFGKDIVGGSASVNFRKQW